MRKGKEWGVAREGKVERVGVEEEWRKMEKGISERVGGKGETCHCQPGGWCYVLCAPVA